MPTMNLNSVAVELPVQINKDLPNSLFKFKPMSNLYSGFLI